MIRLCLALALLGQFGTPAPEASLTYREPGRWRIAGYKLGELTHVYLTDERHGVDISYGRDGGSYTLLVRTPDGELHLIGPPAVGTVPAEPSLRFLLDAAEFQLCMGEPTPPLPPDPANYPGNWRCVFQDHDRNGQVTLSDWAVMVQRLGGTGGLR